MAYRTFENEKYFKAPEIDYFPKTINLLQQAMARRVGQQQRNRALAANYEADKLTSKFTTDQDALNELTRGDTNTAVKDFMNYGQLSPNTIDQLNRHRGYKQISDAQWQMKEDLEKTINDRVIRGPKAEKNYFNKDVAQQKIINAAYGNPDEDITWMNRGDRLKAAASQIGNDYINEFNKDAFVSDYIDEMKTQSIRKSNTGKSGATIDNKVTAVFFDKNGVPRVTDEHAINFLNSSPDIRERYKQEVDLELIDDARKMAATKDGAWVGDMLQKNPRQVVELFRQKPELNTISNVSPGARERELARKDLDAKHRVTLDNSYDYSDYDENKARGIKSKDWGQEYAFNPNDFGGVGGVIINQKTGTKGMPIKIGKAFDKNQNRITGNDKSPRTVHVDTYNLLPVDRSTGKPIALPGGTVEEQIESLNKLTDIQFKNLDLKTVIHGKSYNDRDLDLVRKEYETLRLSPESGLTDEKKNRKEELENTLNEIDQNPDMAPEIISSKLGVVVDDIIKGIDRGTTEAKEIKGKYGGFDITDPKNYDEDQKRLVEAFNARKKQAEERGYGAIQKQEAYEDNIRKITGKKTPTKKETIPTVTSQEDYDKIPPGGEYIVDGKTYRKKK